MAVQLHNVTAGTDRLPQRLERKFYVLPRKADFAYGLLRHICRLDGEYPSERINSLYFDSGDLDEYNRSREGDSRKHKVRIRWYGDDHEIKGICPAFIELKVRKGFAGTKQRIKIMVPSPDLEMSCLRGGIVPGNVLCDALASFGYMPAFPLYPVIKIAYWRYRFVEPLSGQRLSLDLDIKSTMIMPGIGCGEKNLEIPGGVIELKGQNLELPVMLSRLKLLDLDWTRFSKYAACIDSHLEMPGTAGRLSPSGRIVY